MSEKLKIGIILNGPYTPTWSYLMLEKVQKGNYAKIVSIININPIENKKRSIFRKLLISPRALMWLLFRNIDAIFFRKFDKAFTPRKIQDLNIPEAIYLTRKDQGGMFEGLESELESLLALNLDVIINLIDIDLDKKLSAYAKFGIWHYNFGDRTDYISKYNGVWEVFNNCPVTGIMLLITGRDSQEKMVISKSYSRTDYTSILKNQNNYIWKAISILPEKLRELNHIGPNEFFQKYQNEQHPEFYSNSIFSYPDNWKVFTKFIEIFAAKFTNLVRKLFFFNQWILLYQVGSEKNIYHILPKYKKILPPKDREWADPFIIGRNGKYYVFIEELLFKNGKGHISVFELNEDGSYSFPEPIIEKDYHLSYPFLFEDNNTLYMIPETSKNKRIELYKCVNFPEEWVQECVLMDNVMAVDTTIIKLENKYWLFTNLKEIDDATPDDELYLFYSDRINSQNWIPHPMNPVISDVRFARSAGNLFYQYGKLYRPAQNCSNRYGYGMNICQIERINENSFSYKVVNSILPDWEKQIFCTHTFNFTKNISIVDARIRRRK